MTQTADIAPAPPEAELFPTPGLTIRVLKPGSEGALGPWGWLEAGWQDFRRAGLMSLFFGLMALAFGAILITFLVDSPWPWAVFPAIAGFLLVGPAVALGLYEISRRIESGEPLEWMPVLTAFRRNPGPLAQMGLTLTVVYIFWLKVAGLIFALFYGASGANPEAFLTSVMAAPQFVPFFIVGNAAGALFALTVFSLSAISLPLLLSPQMDVPSAVFASLKAVRANPGAMLTWALIIVAMMLLSAVTLGLGLAVALPVIGHATWHARRELAG